MNRKGVLILGPVGSGKGTLAKNIAKRTRYHHISIGDLCRGKVEDPFFQKEYDFQILNQKHKGKVEALNKGSKIGEIISTPCLDK